MIHSQDKAATTQALLARLDLPVHQALLAAQEALAVLALAVRVDTTQVHINYVYVYHSSIIKIVKRCRLLWNY